MTVYELIQELTSYDANAEVKFNLNTELNLDNFEFSDKDSTIEFQDELDYDTTMGKKYLNGEECWIQLTY